MGKTRTTGKGEDSYLELVRECPLKLLKDDADHARATEMAARLMGTPLDAGTGDYLDALLVLITKYEEEHHELDTAAVTPQAALRYLMEANGLSQAEVGRIIGSESAVSMFLSGKRDLSKSHVVTLAKHFAVSTDLFLTG